MFQVLKILTFSIKKLEFKDVFKQKINKMFRRFGQKLNKLTEKFRYF